MTSARYELDAVFQDLWICMEEHYAARVEPDFTVYQGGESSLDEIIGSVITFGTQYNPDTDVYEVKNLMHMHHYPFMEGSTSYTIIRVIDLDVEQLERFSNILSRYRRERVV